MKIIKPSVEVLTPIDGDKVLKHIEKCGRTCYQSYEKETKDAESAKRMVKMLIQSGHESVLEHFSITVKFKSDIGVYKDITRHRAGTAYSIESTRFCVAGNTKLRFNNPHKHFTIEELYNNILNSKNGAWKRLLVAQVNEDTGLICFSKIKNVFFNGERETYKVQTKLGYNLVCTPDHRIYTPNGFISLNDINVGNKIYVNGIDECHQRIHHQSLQQIFADEVISKEYFGTQKVYDIEMDGNYHNYNANGIIVHNCNYSKDKFGNELTFIKPCNIDELSDMWNEWVGLMEEVELTYRNMAKLGAKPDQLRMILPHSTAAEVCMTANLRSWRHIFKMRCAKAAHPSVQQIMKMILREFASKIPVVFDDLMKEYGNEE